MTLNTATLNSSYNTSVPAKQAALAAVVDQLVVDACDLVSEGACMCMCWYMWQLYNHYAVWWAVLLYIFEVTYMRMLAKQHKSKSVLRVLDIMDV